MNHWHHPRLSLNTWTKSWNERKSTSWYCRDSISETCLVAWRRWLWLSQCTSLGETQSKLSGYNDPKSGTPAFRLDRLNAYFQFQSILKLEWPINAHSQEFAILRPAATRLKSQTSSTHHHYRLPLHSIRILIPFLALQLTTKTNFLMSLTAQVSSILQLSTSCFLVYQPPTPSSTTATWPTKPT